MSYRGQQAVLPAGQGGFNADANNNNIPITDLVIARNIRYYGNAWEKAPGLESFDSNGITGSPNILNSIQYVSDRLITAADDGKVYREVGGDLDAGTLVSGLDFTDAVVMVMAGEESFSVEKKLLMFSRAVAPYYIDGDGLVMNLITDIPVDWAAPNYPNGAVYHDSRVVAYMRHNLYFSNLADHIDFLTDDPPIISVAPGFSNEIVCAFSYLPEQLYVWKYPFGIFAVDTTDITGLIIPIRTVKQDIGGAGPRAVCRVKNDVWFVSSTGHVHSLTAVESSEDTTDSDITAMLNLESWISENVDLSKLSQCVMTYHEERQEVWVAYTTKDAEEGINNVSLVFDVSQPDKIRCAVDDRGEFFQTLFQYKESDGTFQVFLGGTGGKIYRANTIARSIDQVTPYTSMFEYPQTDLSYADPEFKHCFKRFDWLEITAIPSGNYSMTFDIYIDGNHSQTVSVNLGQSGAALDSFVLDTDRLGGGDIVNHKVRIHGRGRRISVRGTNTGTNENFIITELMIHCRKAQTEGTS